MHLSFFARIRQQAQRLYRGVPRQPRAIAAGLFFFALSWRLLYLHQIAAQSPFFDSPEVDAQTYFQQAERLATEFSFGEQPFWQPPLYPAFLGVLYLLFGADFYVYRLVQFALGSLSVALLYLIGQRVFSPRLALAAGVVAAIYGPLIYFEGELLPPVLATFLNLSLLLFLLRDSTPRQGWSCLTAGLLLGLAGIAVPTVLPFGLSVAGWLVLRRDLGRPAARLGRALLLVLGTLSVIGVVTLRNYYTGRDLVVLSWNSGLNFYLGNNPAYDRAVKIRPGMDWYELMQRPKQAGLERPAEQSAYFWKAGLSFIQEHPVAYGRLLARKVELFWQGGEIRRNMDIYFARRYSPLLAALVWQHKLAFPFGLLGPLALVGLLLAAKERQARLPVLFVLSYAGAVVAFFVTARYRLPVIPLLILLACYAGAGLQARLWARQWRSALPLLTLLLVLGWALNARAVTQPDDAQEQFYVGLAYARKGMVVRAASELQKALELDPQHYEARFKLAELYHTELEDPVRAEEHYRYLVEMAPGRTAPRRNLAYLYLADGRIAEALALFEETVDLEPDAASYLGLAGAYRLSGRLEEAEVAYRKVLELDPGQFEAHYNLAFLYDQKGREQEAEQEYKKLIERRPEHLGVRDNLGVLYLKRRDFAAAAAEFTYILGKESDHRLARRHLAWAYEGMGRYDEAVQQYERLVQSGEEEQVHNHLARLYRKLGDLERARKEMYTHRGLLRAKELLPIFRSRTGPFLEGTLDR